MISFEQASSLSLGRYIRVFQALDIVPTGGFFKQLRKRNVVLNAGWIAIGSGAGYRYFETNMPSAKPLLSDLSLDQLKAKVTAYLEDGNGE